MKPLMTIIPAVALAALVATPSFAASGRKHVRHYHHSRVMHSYNYAPGPQHPVFFNGRMIGRADDPNIRYQMRNDEAQKYR